MFCQPQEPKHQFSEECAALTGRCLCAAQCGSEGYQPEEPCWGSPSSKPRCPLVSHGHLLTHTHIQGNMCNIMNNAWLSALCCILNIDRKLFQKSNTELCFNKRLWAWQQYKQTLHMCVMLRQWFYILYDCIQLWSALQSLKYFLANVRAH